MDRALTIWGSVILHQSSHTLAKVSNMYKLDFQLLHDMNEMVNYK